MCSSSVQDNFRFKSTVNKPDIRFYDVNKTPFKIYGVFYEDSKFRRMPSSVAERVNEGVVYLHTNTAGGRVRFRTDSPYVAIHAELSCIDRMAHFTLTGSGGFDMYVKEEADTYAYTFFPDIKMELGYEDVCTFSTSGMRDITINFPLYCNVDNLYIGLSEIATVCEPSPYKHKKPIVYYGSSITQGGCASRPGNAYTAVMSRRFDIDHINLGFSGSARGEVAIAEYIRDLDMSVFVYDYDHNAPSPRYLEETHERMFRIIREANPALPIVMMAQPMYIQTENTKKRLAIISKTYENALSAGDCNVYMLTGTELMALAGNEGTVDNCHPNDLGFASMANALGGVLEKILGCQRAENDVRAHKR